MEFLMRLNSPYNLGMPNERVYKRVSCTLESMGYPFNIRELPWKRAQANVRNNTSQAFFPAANNKGRERDFVRSAEVNNGSIYWLVNDDVSISPAELNILALPFDVGLIRGTNAETWANKQNFKVTSVNEQEALLKMFNSKRLPAILISKGSLDSLEADYIRINYKTHIAYQRSQYVFFSKQFIALNSEFLTLFNRHLSTCNEGYKR